MNESTPKWLEVARELFSISQTGLTYCKNEYDLHNYRRLQEISAEIIANEAGFSLQGAKDVFSMQAGYATPKVDVRGAVIRDGKILLVKEKADGRWAMPGGWADIGETPAQMVEREVLEESGFKVRAAKVMAVHDANRAEPMEFFHAYKIIFLCEIISGEACPDHEILAVDFFDPTALPPLSLARTNEDMVQEAFAHLQDSSRPTAFD